MTAMEKDVHKIRFKFANGEEFEAEGSLDFVEKQRDYFLSLVKKKPLGNIPSTPTMTRRLTGISTVNNTPHLTSNEDSSVSGTLTPRLYATAPGSYASESKKVEQNAPFSSTSTDEKTVFSGEHLWAQLLAQEGENLYLRRKFRLSPDEAALILLAGGKSLLGKPGCSALWLSRAMEKSGFSVGRLDRLLTPALKLNFLLCQGSKRSRLYMLTPTGLAHAFVVAEKKVQMLL